MDVTCVSSVMAVQKLKFPISFRFHWKPGNPSFHEILRIALRKLIFWEKEQDGETWNECETAVQKTLRSRQKWLLRGINDQSKHEVVTKINQKRSFKDSLAMRTRKKS